MKKLTMEFIINFSYCIAMVSACYLVLYVYVSRKSTTLFFQAFLKRI